MKNHTSIQLLFCVYLLLSACSPQKQLATPKNGSPAIATKALEDSKVLYIVDGKTVSKDEVDKLDPNGIVSIDVIKNKEEVKKYATENYDGVVVIHMKKK
jgi:hypothetical protein